MFVHASAIRYLLTGFFSTVAMAGRGTVAIAGCGTHMTEEIRCVFDDN